MIEAEGIRPTDLSSVVLHAHRETVEYALGSPEEVVAYGSHNIATYRFNLGQHGKGWPTLGLDGQGGPSDPYVTLAYITVYVLMQPYLVERQYQEQRGEMTIVYDENGQRVVWYEIGTSDILATSERANTPALAELGDDEAQFQVALRSRPGAEQWRWLCYSANQRNESAMNFMGAVYYFGLRPYERDWIKSYMWFSLAASTGQRPSQDDVKAHAWWTGLRHVVPPGKHVRAALPDYPISQNDVFRGMSTSEVRQAEELANSWKPNPNACSDATHF